MKLSANRSAFRRLTQFCLLGLILWTVPGIAQNAPWQQPPGERPPDGESIPEKSGNLNDEYGQLNTWLTDDEQIGGPFGNPPGFLQDISQGALKNRFWFRGEYLAWWTKGFAVPELLSTSPVGTSQTQAGVLSNANASVLFGNGDLHGGFRSGERVTFGTWIAGCQAVGVEATYLNVNRQTDSFNLGSDTVPILARPFLDIGTGQQDAQPISYPGVQSGRFSADASSNLQAVEFLIRKNVQRQPNIVIDFLVGYRFQQLEDHLGIDDTTTFTSAQGSFPAGSIVQQSDNFDARNVFQGAEMGVSSSVRRPWWSVDTMLKIAVGQTHSRATIDGATSTTVAGQATTQAIGGLLALPSNIGSHDSNQFSVVPEWSVTLGLDLSPQLRATIGYDLLYWNNVARPGDQIDTNIDPQQLPSASGTGATKPEFRLHTSDYWAQGVNLGLDLRF